MIYNLVDIHCHSNLSFDGFENNPNGLKFNIKKIFKNSKVKMICITDHNIFDYKKYLLNARNFKKIKKKCLPGMELTIDGVHWIIILDDKKLSINNIGVNFSKELLLKINIDINNYNVKELENKNYCSKDVIQLLDKYEINYIAIPHLDKDQGIFHKGTVSDEKIKVFLNYLRDNIVYGFETKYHDKFFEKRINQINKNIKIMEESQPDKIERLYSQLKNLESAKRLSSAFVYGSDFHGKNVNDTYEKYEKQLFYMKSECSFQGLRLALIDYDSRIFSCDRYNLFKKDTNKILEYIKLKIGKDIVTINFSDGLNSIIGSRGTGKSYILRSIIGNNSNYIGSDIFDKVKILKIKLRNEEEKEFLDENIDVDFISQKNSGLINSNNIYDLLSEAPYNTDKFVKKIRKLSTNTNRLLNIDKYFENVNSCISAYIELNNIKTEPFDYSFMKLYNKFYYSTGATFKIINIFEKYVFFCDKHIKLYNNEIEKLEKFNCTIDEFEQYLEFTKNVKNYKFKEYEDINKYLIKLRDANKEKIETDKKNIFRIEKTKKFVEKMNDVCSKDVSNEDKFFNNSFHDLSLRISKLLNKMQECFFKSRGMEKLNASKIFDKEDITINKSSVSIDLSIESVLNIFDEEIGNLPTIFKNYNQLNYSKIKFRDIFDDFGDMYIENILENKDKRVSKGIYNGYDIFKPEVTPTIIINYNGEEKNLAKISPGEKADILLDLILDPNSSKILIIDQPEDDLDNETIFNKVVAKLRLIKLRRQIIIISHNANLVINGDSDKILICIKENNDYNVISDTMESLKKYVYHSINNPRISDNILNISTHILDGGKEALSRRVKKIGYKEIFFKEDNNEIDNK